MTVISRTEKTMMIKIYNEIKRVKISIYENKEQCYPLGKYSMAPIMDADDTKVLEKLNY